MPILPPGDIVFLCFCATTGILLFYYIYFFARLAFYKPQPGDEEPQPPVSVIVCAKDEGPNLARNIPGLIFQQYDGSLELVIVNDNSTDETKYILQELKSADQKLSIVNLENEAKLIAGKKYPLSIGIREAKNELLLLTDADCVPATEHWVAKMQAAHTDAVDIVLGYGAYQKLPGLLNKLIRFETFHSALQYLSYALAGVPYMGVGRNLSYKKHLFLNNKGFSSINHLPGGDDDLFINKVATCKNTSIVIDAEAHTVSTPKTTWASWRKQKTRHYSTSKYYKTKHKFLLGLYSLVQFLFYPLLIASLVIYDWRYATAVFIIKTIFQHWIFGKAMKQLNEADLATWTFAFDIWMFFYYLLFAPTLVKKEQKTW